MEETILEVKHLAKSFKRRQAVKDISFTLNKGEILGFLGPNGAGKTTVIRMITGLMKMDAGEVKICAYDLKTQFEEALRHIGAVVETPHLYEYLSGEENLKLFAELRGDISKEQIENVKQISGLGDRLKDKVKNYSLGMKQRLGLAVALINEPELLILDEPTNGLDPAGIKVLREFLKDYAHHKGKGVLVSSHILSEMQLLCDRIAIISEGEMKCITSMSEISNQEALEALYIEQTGGSHEYNH